MGRHMFPLPDLVIANGQTTSNTINDYLAGDGFRDADSITIHAPDTLPETVTVNVDSGPAGAPVNFNALQRNGADVTIPVGKSVTISGLSFRGLQLVAGGAVAGTRTFKVTKDVFV